MSSIKTVVVPKWGMEMKEGLIADWHVAVGSKVKAGDDIVDIETAKIVNTATTPVAGVVRKLIANTGETLPCGAPLCLVADAGVSDEEIEAFAAALGGGAPSALAEATPQPAAVAPAAEATTEVAVAPVASAPTSTSTADDSQIAASAVARRLAARHGINLNNVQATGRHGRVSKADVEAAAKAAGQSISVPARAFTAFERDDSQVVATPVARRLAGALGVNLLDCKATGRHGRVSKADVEAAAARSGQLAVAERAVVGEVVQPVPEQPAGEPLSRMRKVIARRLQESKQSAPHFRVHTDIEVDALMALRKSINAQRTDAKVSVNDFIIKAVACALQRVPKLNVQFDGESVTRFDTCDIAVAVAINDGVITPIIKDAGHKGLVEISNEMRDLATRAKIGKLKTAEFVGGTFSISNLGMYDITAFDAIINPPHVAILAVSTASQRPVVRDGALAVASVMTVSLSCDHRVIDGADGAVFLSTLKSLLEQPGTMLA